MRTLKAPFSYCSQSTSEKGAAKKGRVDRSWVADCEDTPSGCVRKESENGGGGGGGIWHDTRFTVPNKKSGKSHIVEIVEGTPLIYLVYGFCLGERCPFHNQSDGRF